MHPHSDQKFIPPWQLASLPPQTPVLLALSGGADSGLLLHLLSQDAAAHGYALHLAHVNHGIRGAEADRDEVFCRTLAEQYALPLHILSTDVPALAKASGEGLEATARRVRYDFFADLMEKHGIPLLATAHHADDNLETVLLHLTRGCGAAGLGGIAPCRPFGRGYLTRPLLKWTRQEIVCECQRYGLEYVTDSTNADTAYARNLVRAEIVPRLERLADHPQKQVLRTCEALREDDALLTQMAADALRAAQSSGRCVQSIAVAALQAQPLPIRKRMLMLMLAHLGGPTLASCHLNALLHLTEVNGSTNLPEGWHAQTEGGSLTFSSCQAPTVQTQPFCIPLEKESRTYPDAGFRVTLFPIEQAKKRLLSQEVNTPFDDKAQNVYNTFILDAISFDTISTPAHWRSRKEGDVFLFRGMNRRLRKLQNEYGIPAHLRDRLPLLCDEQGILWAPGIGTRDGAALRGEHPQELRLTLLPDNKTKDF